MTTFQKVARAIWALNDETDCDEYNQLAQHAQDKANSWARAGIEALRDPPANILLAAGMPYGGTVDAAVGLQMRQEAWNKMLDAILAEVSA